MTAGCRRRVRQPNVPFHAVHGQRLPDGGWQLRIGRRLKTPNQTLWTAWWAKKKERDDWEVAVRNALVSCYGVLSWHAFLEKRGPAETRRMRLVVVREVANTRHFIRDRMNLVFSTKHLHDALQHCGVIRDDDTVWLDAPDPKQEVSEDGLDWTVVTLTPSLEQESKDGTTATQERPDGQEGRLHDDLGAGRGREADLRHAEAPRQRAPRRSPRRAHRARVV